MQTHVFIDSCAWNELFARGIDLDTELPSHSFILMITPGINLELFSMPDVGKDGADKTAIKAYVKNYLERRPPTMSAPFGFACQNEDGSLSKYQPYAGFDQGTFQSPEDRRWHESESMRNFTQLKDDGKPKKIKNSGVPHNGTDAELSVRARDSIVLTNEKPNKNGPLKLASSSFSGVINLRLIPNEPLAIFNRAIEVAELLAAQNTPDQ